MAARFPAGAVHVSLDGAENAGVLVPEAAAALVKRLNKKIAISR